MVLTELSQHEFSQEVIGSLKGITTYSKSRVRAAKRFMTAHDFIITTYSKAYYMIHDFILQCMIYVVSCMMYSDGDDANGGGYDEDNGVC